jgi:hypothetical protein
MSRIVTLQARSGIATADYQIRFIFATSKLSEITLILQYRVHRIDPTTIRFLTLERFEYVPAWNKSLPRPSTFPFHQW